MSDFLRKRVPDAWNRFWFADVDGLPWALTRIGIASAGWVLWLGTLPLLRHFYSDRGEFPIAEARAWSAEYVARFLMLDGLGAFWIVVALFALWGVALLALTLGWHTRVAAWGYWILTTWFFYRNPSFVNGGDEVIRLTSLYLAVGYSGLAPRQRALSLDRRREERKRGEVSSSNVGASDPMPVWPLRMVQIQICVVYLVAGFWKLIASPWWDGSALIYALGNPTFSRFGAPEWAWAHPLFLALTVTVAWWEFLFPVLMVGRRTRFPSLMFGVALHGMILALMNIGVFPFIMLGCYPAFLAPSEARWIVAKAGWVIGRAPTLGNRSAQPSLASTASAAEDVSS